MTKIKSVKVSNQFAFENHNVNASELGRPKTVDGKSYISGQKIRYMIMSAMSNLNDKSEYVVSTGDAPMCDVTKDLRSDICGYMDAENKGSYANRRTSPLRVAFATSSNKSKYFDDLFVRFKQNQADKSDNGNQRINNKVYSHSDIFNVNISLDCTRLSSTEIFEFKDNKYLSRETINHVDEIERKRRVELVINSLLYLQGLANQARNAVENKAIKTFICFDTIDSFDKFFDKSETDQKMILSDLELRGVKYFIGDNTNTNLPSVDVATQNAIKYLQSNDVELNNESTRIVEYSKFESDLKIKFDAEVAAKAKSKKDKKSTSESTSESDTDTDAE